jgi:glycosyltransferase involved in cell wall biosynthesis
LIIINDGAQEDIDQVVQNFPQKKMRVYKKVQKETKTLDPVATWNSCLQKAKGKYFLLFADDDLLEPLYLESMVKLISSYPKVNLFSCRFNIIAQDEQIIDQSPTIPEFESGLEYIWNHLNEKRQIKCTNYIYQRESLLQKGGFFGLPMAWGSDVLTNYALALNNGIASTNEILCSWRKSSGNITGENFFQEKINALLAFEPKVMALMQYYEKVNPQSKYITLIKKRLPIRLSEQKLVLLINASPLKTKYRLHFLTYLKNRKKYSLRFRAYLNVLLARLRSKITIFINKL